MNLTEFLLARIAEDEAVAKVSMSDKPRLAAVRVGHDVRS